MNIEDKCAFMDHFLNHQNVKIVDKVTIEENYTINNYYSAQSQNPAQMPPGLEYEPGLKIYLFLTEYHYIATNTSSASFLYLMGCTPTPPYRLKKVSWLKTLQQLRTMLTLAFDQQLNDRSILLADIERSAPLCFLNKGKAFDVLPKPTKESSIDLDRLKKFFGSL